MSRYLLLGMLVVGCASAPPQAPSPGANDVATAAEAPGASSCAPTLAPSDSAPAPTPSATVASIAPDAGAAPAPSASSTATSFQAFSPPAPPTPPPKTADAKDAWGIGQIDPSEGRMRLMPKVTAGRATPDEVAVLGSLCTSLRDVACVDLCKKKGWSPPQASAAADSGAPKSDLTTREGRSAALDAAESGLDAVAHRELPGSISAGGGGTAGPAKELGGASATARLSPNKCYTVVAYSPAGQIQEYELSLEGPGLKKTTAKGAAPPNAENVVFLFRGRAAFCPVLKEDTLFTIAITVKKGEGAVIARAYERPRR